MDGCGAHLPDQHRGFNTPIRAPDQDGVRASPSHPATGQHALPAHPWTLSWPMHPHPRPRLDVVRWHQRVTPGWLASVMQGQAVAAAPSGCWRLVEVGCREPADDLHSHSPGACCLGAHPLEGGPFWHQVADANLLAVPLAGAPGVFVLLCLADGLGPHQRGRGRRACVEWRVSRPCRVTRGEAQPRWPIPEAPPAAPCQKSPRRR